MTARYKFKFRSHPKPVTTQEFTVGRPAVVAYVAKVAEQNAPAHSATLRDLFVEALKSPDWTSITITVKS